MNNIITIDPEQVLQKTDANVFMVIWTNSQGTFFGTGGGGFQNAAHGDKMDSPAVMRNNAIQEYYNLVRIAKSHPVLTDGRVDLIPMPTF
jgi:hypothetical protein